MLQQSSARRAHLTRFPIHARMVPECLSVTDRYGSDACTHLVPGNEKNWTAGCLSWCTIRLKGAGSSCTDDL